MMLKTPFLGKSSHTKLTNVDAVQMMELFGERTKIPCGKFVFVITESKLNMTDGSHFCSCLVLCHLSLIHSLVLIIAEKCLSCLISNVVTCLNLLIMFHVLKQLNYLRVSICQDISNFTLHYPAVESSIFTKKTYVVAEFLWLAVSGRTWSCSLFIIDAWLNYFSYLLMTMILLNGASDVSSSFKSAKTLSSLTFSLQSVQSLVCWSTRKQRARRKYMIIGLHMFQNLAHTHSKTRIRVHGIEIVLIFCLTNNRVLNSYL